jgi:hypothetical protein
LKDRVGNASEEQLERQLMMDNLKEILDSVLDLSIGKKGYYTGYIITSV